MTRLLADLEAIAAQHPHRSADESVTVPVGVIRAAITMLARYEGWQMADRYVMPDWLAYQAAQKLPGAGNLNLALARREMAR
jgi:hypothetical protein